jgi:hypothetical protein
MNKKVEFQSICADCSDRKSHIFFMDRDYPENDCADNCVIWNNIVFYGIPFDLSDEQMNCVDEGDYRDAIKIGEMHGCIILCKQILDDGCDPMETCDDVDGDLEYIISALCDEEGPLNAETGDAYQDIYYIDELKMEQSYNYTSIRSRIIDELPTVIRTFFHFTPDLIAYYPAPLEYALEPSVDAKYQILGDLAAQKIDIALEAVTAKGPRKHENILNFADAYQFSEDELNIVMGRRNSGSSYPEEVKDKEEYAFYEANGFEEAGESRLLYKHV